MRRVYRKKRFRPGPGISEVGDLFGRGRLLRNIGTSALLTTTMGQQKNLEQVLTSAGLRDRSTTMVGGVPVTGRWAARIGADAYAEDAQDGVVKVRELLSMS